MHQKPNLRAKSDGQVMIYLITTIAMLMFMGYWLVDFNTVATSRIRAQSAADGSALAAAQWQARSLNAIGEINLIKAVEMVALVTDPPPMDADLKARFNSTAVIPEKYDILQSGLDALQERIGFVGPILAMMASQQAAKNGGIKSNPTYTQDMYDQANLVKKYYAEWYSSEGWDSQAQWADQYANMLFYLADNGIAAGEDNATFYWAGNLVAGPLAWEYLLNQAFYSAIANKDWCYLKALLAIYTGWGDWGLVTVNTQVVHGAEYFNLYLEQTAASAKALNNGTLYNYVLSELNNRNLQINNTWPPDIKWATYSSYWGDWTKMDQLVAQSGLVAPVRSQYDFRGADARTGISIPNQSLLALNDRGEGWSSWVIDKDPLMDSNTNLTAKTAFETSVNRMSSSLNINASAAAKPFGALPGINQQAYTFGIVLPIYTDVRLVPKRSVDSRGSLDRLWLAHTHDHVPRYTQSGPSALEADCFYCQQLMKWDDPAFRQEGKDWLNQINPKTGKLNCLPPDTPPPPPGPGPVPRPIGGGGSGGGGGPGGT